MKAYVIALTKIESSWTSGQRVLADLKTHGLDAEIWPGTQGDEAVRIFQTTGRELRPISFKGHAVDQDYRAMSERAGVKGCFLSHYRLWQHCMELDQAILIFEDDVIFERRFIPVEWDEVLLLATGKNVHEQPFYQERLYDPKQEPCAGKFKGKVMPGAVGYGLTPAGAQKLVKEYQHYYLPADNAMNTRVVRLQCHTHLMGRAATNGDGKKSLTKTRMWLKMLERDANTPRSA